MGGIEDHVKGRRYDAAGRRAASRATRRHIVDAARASMLERGYRRTSMTAVAAAAGVHVDTVYALVGRKADLLREVLEQAISGQDRPVPAEQRDYVQAIRAAPTAPDKLRIYAAAVAEIQPRLAPLAQVVHEAGPSEPAVAALWSEIADRRAANMRRFVHDVRAAAPLRAGLTAAHAADVVWMLTSTETYVALTEGRGWSAAAYERWLADAMARLLLDG